MAVDGSDCTIAQPSEGAASLNVAVVRPADTEGICGPEACLVTLDAGADHGWEEIDRRIALPPAVCERLESGAAIGVAVTVACPSKTWGVPTCGPWSSVTTQPGSFDGPASTPCPFAACVTRRSDHVTR